MWISANKANEQNHRKFCLAAPQDHDIKCAFPSKSEQGSRNIDTGQMLLAKKSGVAAEAVVSINQAASLPARFVLTG